MMLLGLLPHKMCPIRLDLEREHEEAMRASDIDYDRRSPADTLRLQQRVLDTRIAWTKHCQICENCNALLRLE
jgi:hypothetical protein